MVSRRVPTLIKSITLVVPLLTLGATVRASANSLHADDCIAAPNSASPPGKHWYYRLDWATKRKCWYVGPVGRSAQEVAPSAAKGRVTPLRTAPAHPNKQMQADDPPLSRGEARPPSPPVKMTA